MYWSEGWRFMFKVTFRNSLYDRSSLSFQEHHHQPEAAVAGIQAGKRCKSNSETTRWPIPV